MRSKHKYTILAIAATLPIWLVSSNAFATCAPAGRCGGCTVSTANVAFGNINSNVANSNSGGQIQVTCTKSGGTNGTLNISYTVTVAAGGSNNQLARAMKGTNNSAHTLSYNLYKEAGFVNILGDGNGGTTQLSNTYSIPNGSASHTDTFTVFAQIPAQTSAFVDSYTDSNILVTVTY